MTTQLFEENPHDRGTRRALTLALTAISILLVLRLLGIRIGPAWLLVHRYDVLLPATLIVAAWRLLAAQSAYLSRKAATKWILGITWAVTFLFFWPHIDSDGDYYYGYLRSILWDHDFNLSNEAAWYATGWMKGLENALNTTTGYIFSAHTIGPTLFWLPFVLVSHAVATVLSHLGYPTLTDGYDLVYRFGVSFGTWTFVLATFLICIRILETWFCRAAALVAVLGMYLASPLLCYGFHSGSFSHGLSCFATSLGLLMWVKNRGRFTLLGAIGIGFPLGVACMIRPQNVLWLLLPLLDYFLSLNKKSNLREAGLWLAAFGGSAGIGFAPQLTLWYIERLSFLSAPQGPGFVDAGRWNQLQVLFHPFHGLFLWHPLHFVAFIGLIGFAMRYRRLGWLLILGFALQVWINGAAEDWWAGGAFGLRRFGSSLPVFMVGLGYLLDRAIADRSMWTISVTGIGCAVLWNVLLFAQVLEGPLYYVNPIELGSIWSDQFTVAPERLELWLTRAPLVRWLWIGIADRVWPLLAAWFALVSVLAALSFITVRTTPRVLALFLSGKSSGKSLWAAGMAGCCVLTLVIVFSDRATTSVPIAFHIEEDNIEIRNLSLHSPAQYEGGYAQFSLKPREERSFRLIKPHQTNALLLVGAQKENSVPETQPILSVQAGKSNIAITGQQIPPSWPSAVPPGHRPAAASIARAKYKGLTSTAPRYAYACPIPLGASRAVETIRFENLTDDVELAIDGMAFLPGASPRPKSSALRITGPRFQRTIPLEDLANTDYQHHVFRDRDKGPWSFFPLLKPGILESNGIRFHILPSFDTTGEWSVVGILHKDTPLSLPLTADRYEGISLAWVAYGTYVLKSGRLPSEEIAVVRLLYQDGTEENHSIVSHRDIYDYRDPYVPTRSLVYQEALYQKICRTDLRILNSEKIVTDIEIRPTWNEGEIGIALFSATAWRKG